MINLRSNSIVTSVVRRIKARLNRPLHIPDTQVPHQVFGSEYGGWPVIEGSLSSQSIVYSIGVGHDISFDLAIIARYGCRIEAFDPTPRCVAWIERQNVPAGFRFHPVGLSDQEQLLRFSAPPEEQFVSYTVAERSDSPEVVELPVRPLDMLMRDLRHRQIDFLKMDIEGSEYQVINDMIAKNIFPSQICVEFHHGMFGYTNNDTLNAVTKLRGTGYKIYYVSPSGREYGFHK